MGAAVSRPKLRTGICRSCRRERSLYTVERCHTCAWRERWHSTIGPQTVLAVTLHPDDVLVQGEGRFTVTHVELQPSELDPTVRVRVQILPHGPVQVLQFNAETFVPVEVSRA
jgi:hypothetical protein